MAFDYVRPASISEAVRILQEAGDGARPISGGQSLMPMINLGLASPTVVVDLWGMPELSLINAAADRVEIGAATTHTRVLSSRTIAEHVPLLRSAAGFIGSPRIRNRGTIGGSVAHGDPSAEFPLACWTLDASYILAGPHGSRTVRAEDFSLGHYATALEDGEILTRIVVPKVDAGTAFHEHSRRTGDFGLASAAAQVQVEDGCVRSSRVVVAGARDRPQRLHELEGMLAGAETGRVAGLIPAALPEVHTHDDPYVPAAYRERLLGVLAKRAVLDAIATHEGKTK